MKIASIVGAKPRFITAAALSRELCIRHEIILIHTSQQDAAAVFDSFFEGLKIPTADFRLLLQGSRLTRRASISTNDK